jgi:hypothetical protein
MKIDERSASQVIEKVFGGMDAINESAKHVKEHCDGEAFSDYQLKAAVLISNIEDELLKSIYRKYPHLRPY